MNALGAIALAAGTLLLASPSQANTLPGCDAWLGNTLPLGAGKFLAPAAIPEKLVTVDMEPVKAAGMIIEPSRRMRAKDYPWEHEIQVALPPSYGKAPNRRYPVLWVTDGQIFFDLATALMASCGGKAVPEMIIVAVGPPPEAIKEAQPRRTFDFGPEGGGRRTGFGASLYTARDDADKARQQAAGKPPVKTGGAARFLSFIVDDVRPQLAKEYRMSGDNTLFGHSGGGLFCGFAVVTKPSAFNRFICGSAPFDANDFQVFRLEEQYAQSNKDMPTRVFFGVGEQEVLQRPWSLVSTTTQLAEILNARAYPSLKLSFRSFEGKGHTTMIPALMSVGLRTVWQGDYTAQP